MSEDSWWTTIAHHSCHPKSRVYTRLEGVVLEENRHALVVELSANGRDGWRRGAARLDGDVVGAGDREGVRAGYGFQGQGRGSGMVS
jgi:hypothetical protein